MVFASVDTPEESGHVCIKDQIATLYELVAKEGASPPKSFIEQRATEGLEKVHGPVAMLEAGFPQFLEMVAAAKSGVMVQTPSGYKICPEPDKPCVRLTVDDAGAPSSLTYAGMREADDCSVPVKFAATFSDLTTEPKPLNNMDICENSVSIAGLMLQVQAEKGRTRQAQQALHLTHQLAQLSAPMPGLYKMSVSFVPVLAGVALAALVMQRVRRQRTPTDGLLEEGHPVE